MPVAFQLLEFDALFGGDLGIVVYVVIYTAGTHLPQGRFWKIIDLLMIGIYKDVFLELCMFKTTKSPKNA